MEATLVEKIREYFDAAKEDETYQGHKKTDWLLDAIEEAGLELHAHQGGINGTYLTISEKITMDPRQIIQLFVGSGLMGMLAVLFLVIDNTTSRSNMLDKPAMMISGIGSLVVAVVLYVFAMIMGVGYLMR